MKKPNDSVRDGVKPDIWTTEGFIDEFMRINRDMEDRSFLFILGSGASVSSGIPSGAALALEWVKEIHKFHEGDSGKPFEEWADSTNLDISEFSLDHIAEFYPIIYERRFGRDPDTGYAYLEGVMSKAEPDIGYSILAQILAKTRHKVVITTNFDNLVQDALSLYTDTFPLVCGHESLTGFVRLKLRRPLIAKIHRDLLLAPLNSTNDTSCLDERWGDVLKKLLKEYTPLVIGYGGNDGSFMGFLESLSDRDIEGGLSWCYRVEDGLPSERIQNLMIKLRGHLIPIIGFDEFMVQINARFEWPPLLEEMENKNKERLKRYKERFENFSKNIIEKDSRKSVQKALEKTIEREKTWWAWILKAQSEQDPKMKEKIYRQGIEQFPERSELYGSLANFMKDIRKENEAERLYKKALELDPDNYVTISNFAVFQRDVRKDYDEAERLFKKALEIAPYNSDIIGNFAPFISLVRKNQDEAERLYKKALELDPSNDINMRNYAIFTSYFKKDHHKAEQLFRKAIELDPDNATNIGSYASFKVIERKEFAEAERLFRNALELEPNNVTNIVNFTGFLVEMKRYDEAREFLQRAWRINNMESNQESVELLFYWCILSQMKMLDDKPGLSRLKYLINDGYLRLPWSFEGILFMAKEAMKPEDHVFYSDISAAIIDQDKVEHLASYERWKEITPIDLKQPWEMFE